jgi:hypothetical protein
MNASPLPEYMQPYWFFPLFALLWTGISVVLSMLGGWARLAESFRAAGPVEGERFRFVSGSMGAASLPVSYGNCLFVTVNDAGFGLSILFPFRLFSPPLFIPWSAVESVETRRVLFTTRVVVRLRAHWPVLSVRGSAGTCLLDTQARVARSRAR